MKNTMKRLLCLLLALVMCAGLALGAVADENDPPEEGGNETYATAFTGIKPSELGLFEGQTKIVTADVQPSNYNMGIVWESDEPGIATVDNDGTATATVTAVSAGTATITATVKSKVGEEITSIVQSCTVTVNANVMESITIESENNSGTITGRGTLQLRAYAVYSDGSRHILEAASWSSSDTDIATVTDGGLVNAVGAGTAQITAKAGTYVGALEDTFNIEVKEPGTSVVLSGDRVAGSNGKYTLNLSPGDIAQVIADVQPKNTFAQPGEISWDIPRNSVISVDNGKITAVSNGKVAITVKCAGATSASITVTVGTPSKNITASTNHGTTIRGLSDIQSKLKAAYKEYYNSDPTDDLVLNITPPSKTTYGTLYVNSATSNSNNRITASKDTRISSVSGMYFVPGTVGSYVASYTFFSSDKKTTLLTGNITISVASKSADITIRLSGDSSAYTFSSSDNENKTAATKLISTAIADATGQSQGYYSISFGTPSSASKAVGTLYANSDRKSLASFDDYTASTSGTHPVSKLYFVPANEGTYTVSYTAYDSGGGMMCSGNLIIEVGVISDATVTVKLDDGSGYSFSTKTSRDNTSAAAAIYNAVRDETGKKYSYIKFGSVISGDSVGTLYTDSDRTALKNTKYTYSSSNYSVSDLYFLPETSGNYVRGFTAYDDDNTELLTGTLKIVVPGGNLTEIDLYFNTTTGGSVSLDEDVFESWYRQQKGSSHKLAYVTFDEVSRSFGSFKHSGSSFTPGNNVKYFAEGFTGSTGSNPRYLDNVTYAAPNSTGYVRVDFTCYGGTTASVSSTKVSGTLFLFVTGSSVKGVNLNVSYGSAATLSDGEFSTVHRNAMSLSSGASARHYIQLLEIPSEGTLYFNYTSASRPGTRLTSSNYDDYKFYVNSGSSYDSVSDLTYVPANRSSGTDSVRYLARSTSGEPMYVGTVSFSYGAQQGASVSCSSEGYTFKASDFYSSGDSDPVAYVTFTQPDSGSLMLGFANGRGVYLNSSVKLYTVNSSRGSYPLTSLSYIPRAGFSGNVDIYYTAVTGAGKTRNGIFTIAVSGRKGSSHFKDVLSTGSGAWSADAIDFAYKWGLVNGTGTDTFSPDDTMTRAMLVTILYRSAGSPKVSGSCPFTDVAAGTYYYDAVIWAANNGIVTGTSPTTFSPDRDVNREQVAAFLHRYAKYNGKNVAVTGTLNGYVDKSFVSEYAIEPVSWAVQNGYITSNSGTELLLSPGGNATRAQVAVMLHRFLTY